MDEETALYQHEEKLISTYSSYCLEHHKRPDSVYLFAKHAEIDEKTFYSFFASFDALENRVFENFFQKTIDLLHKSEEYSTYDARTKVLSFYFTYFDLLAANRSFVLLLLAPHTTPWSNRTKLSGLKTLFTAFVHELGIEKIKIEQEFIQKIQEKGIDEASWAQFLLTLKFWIDDQSKSFEKTDIFIEKSIHAAFDLMNTKPFESLVDFGKFLFKEKINPKG